MKKRIAIFASGKGSNAQNILEQFEGKDNIEVTLIVSNKSKAGVLEIAKTNNVPTLLLKRNEFYNTELLVKELEDYKIDYIILAGFLWLIPAYLVAAFPKKIVNIHPALLPKYGGKGMYGSHVHKAVFEAKEKETGITIHFVNEAYDEGMIIHQAKTTLTDKDTPETIAQKVHQLEYEYYPKVIEQLLTMKEERIS